MHDFYEYQKATRETAVYPKNFGKDYVVHGLTNEAGEVSGVRKKYLRGDFDTIEYKEKLAKEVGDVLWYLARICDEHDISLANIAAANLAKLRDRKERGVLKGSGDDR